MKEYLQSLKYDAYLHELMTITMEECAEVIQECSKVIRFGADSEHDGKTAIERLEKEIGDLYCMIDLIHANDLVSFTEVDRYSQEKYEKLRKYSNLIWD
jgi:NTP pyrophosphatase (non-canonical NTP hydrolase)